MLRNQKGFTLMELMVVIVIVAILAAVAVPLYINYVNDARRTEAKGAIGAVITAQQTFYQQSAPPQSYATTMAALNVDLSDVNARWTPVLSAASATGFTIRMNGVPPNNLFVQCVYTRGADAVWIEGP